MTMSIIARPVPGPRAGTGQGQASQYYIYDVL